jgi:hypothetical protein
MELIDIKTDLSEAQIRNLLKGKAAVLKPNIFNENSQSILRLLRSTKNRIDKAHMMGKGCKIVLQEDENLMSNTVGGKIRFKKPHNPFKGTKDLFEDFGAEVKSKSKIVKRKFNEKIVDSGLGKKMASELIDIGTQVLLPTVGAIAGSSMGPLGAAALGASSQIIGDQLNKQAERDGYGLFKAMHKAGLQKYGITKTSVRKTAKKIGKEALNIGADVAGEAITAYTGNPMAGEAFKVGAKRLGNAALESKSGKDVLRKMKKEAKNIGVEMVDDYIDDNFTGVEKDIAQKALVGKYPSAKDLIYDYGNSKIEEAIQLDDNSFMEGYGVGRRVGGNIKAPSMHSDVIQTGSLNASLNSAQMNPVFFLPSPQLAPPILKRGGKLHYGGSMYPAGGRYGGSVYPPG